VPRDGIQHPAGATVDGDRDGQRRTLGDADRTEPVRRAACRVEFRGIRRDEHTCSTMSRIAHGCAQHARQTRLGLIERFARRRVIERLHVIPRYGQWMRLVVLDLGILRKEAERLTFLDMVSRENCSMIPAEVVDQLAQQRECRLRHGFSRPRSMRLYSCVRLRRRGAHAAAFWRAACRGQADPVWQVDRAAVPHPPTPVRGHRRTEVSGLGRSQYQHGFSSAKRANRRRLQRRPSVCRSSLLTTASTLARLADPRIVSQPVRKLDCKGCRRVKKAAF
jgi:hypothetical protein